MERQNADDAASGTEVALYNHVEARTPVRPKPYLSIREVSALTPWTEQAIRTMMTKGVLRHGEHFFHVGKRTLVKWDAIVEFIENGEERVTARIPLRRGGFVGGSTKAQT